MAHKTGKEIIDAIQAAVKGKISHVNIAGQDWVRLWDTKVYLPEGTCVLGPNTATGGASEFNPNRYGAAFDDPSQAARMVLWFKSWDDAVKFQQSIIIEGTQKDETA